MKEAPGVPLASGFTYRPSSECPEVELSDEAKARIDEMWAEFDRSQRIAAQSMNTKRYR